MTSNNKRWTRDEIISLIEHVEAERVLWDPKHPDRVKKNKIKAAHDRIAAAVNVDVESVKKKIATLRSQMSSERSKAKKGGPSGSGGDGAYKPRWEFYNLLLFMYNDDSSGSASVDSMTNISDGGRHSRSGNDYDEDSRFSSLHFDDTQQYAPPSMSAPSTSDVIEMASTANVITTSGLNVTTPTASTSFGVNVTTPTASTSSGVNVTTPAQSTRRAPITAKRKRPADDSTDDIAFFTKLSEMVNNLNAPTNKNVGFATVIGQQMLHLLEKLEGEDIQLFQELSAELTVLHTSFMQKYFQRRMQIIEIIPDAVPTEEEANINNNS